MGLNTDKQIPCRYLVAKYVGDDIRDEPINVGIILQSRNTYEIKLRFITHFAKIRTATEEPQFLRQVLENIQNELARSRDKNALENIVSKYHGKIRFTDPRATVTEALDDETNSLYNRFISIETQPMITTRPLSIMTVKSNISKFFSRVHKPIIKDKWFEGQPGKFKWNFFIASKHLLHSISFNTDNALQTTKLYDWHARDLIEHKKLFIETNFSAIILEPRKDHPKYPKLWEAFKESKKIWDSRDYSLINYDEENDWQKQLTKIITQ